MKKKIRLIGHFLDRISAKELVAFAMIIVISVSYIPIPIVIRDILEALQAEQIDLGQLVLNSAILIIIFILQVIITLASRKVLVSYVRTSVRNLRERLLKGYLYSTDHPDGETVSTIHKKVYTDTEMVDRFFNSLLINILPALGISIIAFAVMIYFNLTLMIWTTALSVLILFMINLFKNKRNAVTADYYLKYSQFNRLVLFILRFRETIYTHAMQDRECQRINETVESVKSQGVKMEMAFTRTTGMQELGQSSILIIILIVSAFMKNQGKIEIEVVFVIFFLIYVIRRQFLLISLHAQNVTEGFISLEKLKTLEDKLAKTYPLPQEHAGEKIEFAGSLAFRNVTFSHEGQNQLLRNASFSLLPNKLNLLQGANGVGKSTIMRLILGYWQPEEGSILIENVNAKNLDYEYFINQISVVLQDNELFDGSIKDNLLYGVSEQESQIETVLARLGLSEWVDRLPLKLETPVSDLSSKISGGEKQRLVIARAILRNPRFLILDEPTNHLDVDFIGEIKSIFNELKKHITILIISHDKSLEVIADQIMTVEDNHVKIKQ